MVGWWAKWKWCLYFMVIFKMLIFHTTCSTITTDEKSFNHDATKHENENTEVLSRHKRYALEGSRWRVNEITYKISKYSEKLSKETVDKIIRKAFNIWAKASNLKFTQKKTGKVHIEIKFDRGNHGDDAPFDGAGGQRAHAFFPGYGGDAHFDDDENWTLDQTNSNDGSRLLLVATHELGHALGIGHSEKPEALMAPSHDEWKGDVKLSKDDIQAIQALYGKPGEDRPQQGDPALGRGPGPNNGGGARGPGRGGPPFQQPGAGPQFRPVQPPFRGPPPQGPPFIPSQGPPPPQQPPPPPRQQPRRRRPSTTPAPTFDYEDSEFFDNDVDSIIENNVEEFSDKNINNKALCNAEFDTMLTMKNDETYVFKDKRYWKLTETAVAEGYPRNIERDWDGLPPHLDAAFTWTNGKMYFFKGNRYWRFSPNKRLDDGFPKNINDGFEGIPANVDAAFVWGRNDKIYFFKGSNYYKFDPKKNPPVDESYPRPMSNWDGIPNNIDAALQYSNGNTYFFKNNQYYRFDEETNSVDRSSSSSYPRNTGEWWFGCRADRPRKLKKPNKDNVRFILD